MKRASNEITEASFWMFSYEDDDDDDDTETVFQETRINVTIIDTKSAVGYHGAAVRCQNSTHGTFATLIY